jgi:hypothetical protein
MREIARDGVMSLISAIDSNTARSILLTWRRKRGGVVVLVENGEKSSELFPPKSPEIARATECPGNRMPGQQNARATKCPGNTTPGQHNARATQRPGNKKAQHRRTLLGQSEHSRIYQFNATTPHGREESPTTTTPPRTPLRTYECNDIAVCRLPFDS